jgi:hypothetical protein
MKYGHILTFQVESGWTGQCYEMTSGSVLNGSCPARPAIGVSRPRIIGDIDQAALIKDKPANFIVADKGYDADAFVEMIAAQEDQAVIPPRSNRLHPRSFDRHIYQDRNLIERFFARIK